MSALLITVCAYFQLVKGKPTTYYAKLAHLVFDAAEQNDKVAIAIITEGADYINMLARKLNNKKPPRLSLIGGLSLRLRPWLDVTLQVQLLEPLNPPEVGSVLFAKNKLAEQIIKQQKMA